LGLGLIDLPWGHPRGQSNVGAPTLRGPSEAANDPFARYNVVGNANEHGLAIGETTFGGLGILDGNGGVGIIDYGSLIWLTLQVGSL
jgi:hypothetical protein